MATFKKESISRKEGLALLEKVKKNEKGIPYVTMNLAGSHYLYTESAVTVYLQRLYIEEGIDKENDKYDFIVVGPDTNEDLEKLLH